MVDMEKGGHHSAVAYLLSGGEEALFTLYIQGLPFDVQEGRIIETFSNDLDSLLSSTRLMKVTTMTILPKDLEEHLLNTVHEQQCNVITVPSEGEWKSHTAGLRVGYMHKSAAKS